MSSAIGIERKAAFTLIELVAVIAISLLLLGFVVGRVGKTPLFLSLNKVSLNLQNLISTAASQAELNGKNIVITYNDFKRTFAPDDSNRFSNRSFNKYLVMSVPDNVQVEFTYPSRQTEYPVKFKFYPDGTSSGPDVVLKLKGQKIVIHISKLTGQPVVTSK